MPKNLDITDGIKKANLELCDIRHWHNSFIIQQILNGNNCISVVANPLYLCMGKQSYKEENPELKFKDEYIGYEINLVGEIQTYKMGSETIVYKDKGDELNYYYYIQNPEKFGANGKEIDISSPKNIMICSGRLSGCSFALLIKNNRLFVIHVGVSNSQNTLDPKGYKNNANIFCMANYLASNQKFNMLSELDPTSMIGLLEDCGFEGFVFFNSFKRGLLIRNGDIIGYTYSTSDLSHPFTDVVCVINKEGKMQVALRPLSGNNLVNCNYKIWEKNL